MKFSTKARLLSIFLLLWFSLARLGESGSYWEAFRTACTFFGIWWLGLLSGEDEK